MCFKNAVFCFGGWGVVSLFFSEPHFLLYTIVSCIIFLNAWSEDTVDHILNLFKLLKNNMSYKNNMHYDTDFNFET